ncbi:MAG: hypothetical protein ABJ327_10785 [Litoreibacter sp.]
MKRTMLTSTMVLGLAALCIAQDQRGLFNEVRMQEQTDPFTAFNATMSRKKVDLLLQLIVWVILSAPGLAQKRAWAQRGIGTRAQLPPVPCQWRRLRSPRSSLATAT